MAIIIYKFDLFKVGHLGILCCWKISAVRA